MVLGFAGYSLLLSSFVALMFLLRIGCAKDILKSPLHILSTSDTFISMITSIILLLNQSWPLSNYSEQASMDETAGRQLGSSYQQNQSCMGFYLNYSNSLSDSQDVGRMGGSCTFPHVLMQYAMFMVPFANAFMSLLIYSVQCSSGISCVAKKCSKLTKSARNTDPEGSDKSTNSKDEKITISKDQTKRVNLKNGSKLTGFGLITQWLVPLLVTAALSLSKPQDMEKLHETNEMDCIFRVNFPLESCDVLDTSTLINRTEYYYDGLNDKIKVYDPDTSRISYPDSGVIDDIISKVRRVVKSAMNKTCNNSAELKNSSSFRPWNITQKNLSNVDDEMLEKLTKIQQILDTKDLGALDTDCTTMETDELPETDREVNEDEELKLFEEAVENAQNKLTTSSTIEILETMQPDAFPQEITEAMTEGVMREDKTDEIQGKSKLRSNETTIITREKLHAKIYEDIIKRIRSTVMQAGNLGDDNSRFRDSKPQIDSLGSGSDPSKVRDERKIFNEFETQLNMHDGCFLSAKFLKIHLSIFLFIVYFVPVLISVILQTRAVYVCENVYQQIGTAGKKDVKKTNENTASSSNSSSGWFPSGSKEQINTVAESSGDLENIEGANMSENTEFSRREDKRTGFKHVLQETKSIQMLFDVLKKSLMLGILMWTPAFLEILSKVFLCSSTPAWLSNFLYFIGLSFGIVKNIVNVNIAKINKHMRDECYGKENSVHPKV